MSSSKYRVSSFDLSLGTKGAGRRWMFSKSIRANQGWALICSAPSCATVRSPPAGPLLVVEGNAKPVRWAMIRELGLLVDAPVLDPSRSSRSQMRPSIRLWASREIRGLEGNLRLVLHWRIFWRVTCRLDDTNVG